MAFPEVTKAKSRSGEKGKIDHPSTGRTNSIPMDPRLEFLAQHHPALYRKYKHVDTSVTGDVYITRSDVVSVAQLSKSTIVRREAEGLFPGRIKVGRLWRYPLSEVIEVVRTMYHRE